MGAPIYLNSQLSISIKILTDMINKNEYSDSFLTILFSITYIIVKEWWINITIIDHFTIC